MKTASRALLSTLAGGALLVSSAVGATAASGQDEVRSHLAQDGVPQNQIHSLQEKMNAGELLDVYKANAKPISVAKSEKAGEKVVEVRYADGSYSIARAQIPTSKQAGAVTPLGLNQCIRDSSGSWTTATNCKVSWSVPAANVEHRINARWIPGIQGAGQVDKVYGPAGGGLGYVAGSASVGISVKNGNPAISTMRASFQSPGVGTDRTFQVFVSRNGIDPQSPQ